jgi:hypothetical protein
MIVCVRIEVCPCLRAAVIVEACVSGVIIMRGGCACWCDLAFSTSG